MSGYHPQHAAPSFWSTISTREAKHAARRDYRRTAQMSTAALLFTGVPALGQGVASASTSSLSTATSTATTNVPVSRVTSMRISGPSAVTAGHTARIGVRVLFDGAHAPAGVPVEIQTLTSGTWRAVAAATTDGGGHAQVYLPVAATQVFRAVTTGAGDYGPSSTPQLTVQAVQTITSGVRISATPAITVGQKARIGVRVLGGGQHASGVPATVQAKVDGVWRNVANVVSDADGHATVLLPLTFSQRLRAVVAASAQRTAATSTEVIVAVAAAPARSLGAQVIAEASRHAGKPYVWGADGPNAFDCSGFTKYVYAKFGKSLPHQSGMQKAATLPVSQGAKQIGDLIFTYSGGRISHVGIYAGNNRMWAAPKTGDVVRLQTIWTTNYAVGRVR